MRGSPVAPVVNVGKNIRQRTSSSRQGSHSLSGLIPCDAAGGAKFPENKIRLESIADGNDTAKEELEYLERKRRRSIAMRSLTRRPDVKRRWNFYFSLDRPWHAILCGSPYRRCVQWSSQTDAYLRMINLQITLLSIAGIVLMVLHNQICWDGDLLIFHDDYTECSAALPLKVGNYGITIAIIYRLCIYYLALTDLKKSEWSLNSRFTAFVGTSLLYKFVAEVVIAGSQPVPGLSQVYGFGHKSLIFMLIVRTYLILRLLRDYATVYRQRFDLVSSQKEMKIHSSRSNPPIDYDTVFKTYFYQNPARSVLSAAFLFTCLFSYTIYILEREFWVPIDRNSGLDVILGREISHPIDKTVWQPGPLSQFHNCVWYIWVTMTTLGLGDITPVSSRGRFITVASCIVGIILTSLVVGLVANRITPTQFQLSIIDWMRAVKIHERKRNLAARIIQMAWRQAKLHREILERAKKMNTGTKHVTAVTALRINTQTQKKGNSTLTKSIYNTRQRDLKLQIFQSIQEMGAVKRHEDELRDETSGNDFGAIARTLTLQNENMKNRILQVEAKIDRILELLSESSFETRQINTDQIPAPRRKRDSVTESAWR